MMSCELFSLLGWGTASDSLWERKQFVDTVERNFSIRENYLGWLKDMTKPNLKFFPLCLTILLFPRIEEIPGTSYTQMGLVLLKCRSAADSL